MAEDPFTSVQWDRGEEPAEEHINSEAVQPNISSIEEEAEGEAEGEVPEGAPEVEPELPSTSPTLPEPGAPAAEFVIDSSVSLPMRDLDAASKPYISYEVTTHTNHPAIIKLASTQPPEGDATTIKVRRRYGDFRFLHECLTNDYPHLLVPPLPSKLNFKYLTGDTFSSPFVHKRLNSLDRFVKYIVQHQQLSQLAIFHLFVSDSAEWLTFTKNLKIKGGDDDLYVNKVVNEDHLTETVMNYLTPSKHKRETNKEILEISEKLKKLYENLLKLDKIFAKLSKKNHDLSQDYDQFAAQVTKLLVVQDTLDDQFAANFKVFSELLSFFSTNWGDLHKYIDESFLVALRDCSKYIVSLTHLIELQHNKKIDLQVLQDYLVKTQNELAGLGRGPQPAQGNGVVDKTTQLIKDTLLTSATPNIGLAHTDNKKARLEAKVKQLEHEITEQTKVVNDMTAHIINVEYPNWDKFNKRELKHAMVGLCDQEILFYRGLMENWLDVEARLAKRLQEL